MFILPPSIYLSRSTSIISDTLTSECVDMPQFYIFGVSFTLKNEIILATILLDASDISKYDFTYLVSKKVIDFKGISLLKISILISIF